MSEIKLPICLKQSSAAIFCHICRTTQVRKYKDERICSACFKKYIAFANKSNGHLLHKYNENTDELNESHDSYILNKYQMVDFMDDIYDVYRHAGSIYMMNFNIVNKYAFMFHICNTYLVDLLCEDIVGVIKSFLMDGFYFISFQNMLDNYGVMKAIAAYTNNYRKPVKKYEPEPRKYMDRDRQVAILTAMYL